MLLSSTDFDVMVPNYRRACGRWPDAAGLQKHYNLLSTYDLDSLGLIESVKSFVESVCVTILSDFRHPLPTAHPSLTELFNAALKPLGMQNTRSGSTVDRLLSAFNRLADALSNVRNEFGALAHGKDGFFGSLTRDENRAFLHTGDAILAMLLNALDGASPDLASTREPYERFQRFNERIDRSIEVSAEVEDDDGPPVILITVTSLGSDEAIQLRVEPSRLLFTIDREAFVEILNASVEQLPIDEQLESEKDSLPLAEPNVTTTAVHDGTLVRLATQYEGRLSNLRPGLGRFLETEGLNVGVPMDGTDLLSSLLATADGNMALDVWKSEARQARLSVSLRRVFSKFGVRQAVSAAGKLVTWLRIQSEGVDEQHGGR